MSAESRVEAIRVLSHAAGADGMVAGQVIDTLCGVSTQQELTGMYRLKTGVMISAAAELGCVASGMPAAMRQQAMKAAMAALGFCENYLRLPLVPMEQDHYETMLQRMRELGLQV